MSDPVQEQLSACLDNELADSELDLLLKRMHRDPEAQRALGRYSLIGEALRNERVIAASSAFASKISAALANEPVVAPRRVRAIPKVALTWLKPAAGMAVAAGVAALAVIVIRPQSQTEMIQPQRMAAQEQIAAPSPRAPVEDTHSYIVPSTPSTAFIPATRLTNYVVAHSEYAAPLGRLTVLNGVLAEDDEALQDAVQVEAAVAVPSP